ncbi:MAG: hypothetical protein PHH11_01590 [Methylomonas sp.]|nr:hypothetical protein [Methylomonas sp.]
MTTLTSQFCLRNRRTISADLYAAMPPQTPNKIRVSMMPFLIDQKLNYGVSDLTHL